MKIELWVTCWRGRRHGGSDTKTSFKREVDWPALPPENGNLMVGRDEEGEGGSISAYVNRVFWGTDEIIVEADIENLDGTDEFDTVRQSIARDGFELMYGLPLP